MFHINLPADRILAGKNSVSGQMVFPEELEWPADAALQGAGTEIFKLRNRDDTVVGIAARIDNARDDSGPFVQWMIHLPARGSLFVGLNIQSSDDGSRNGRFVAGTREFEHMSGSMREAYNASVKTDDMGISGRIELETSLVRTAGDDR
jgi:hypothetical protein